MLVWRLLLLQKKWIIHVGWLCIFYFILLRCFHLQCLKSSQLRPWSHKACIILFIFTSFEMSMSLYMSYYFLDYCHYRSKEVPMKNQSRCWLLACVKYFFFSIECTKVDVISVSVARNFRDLTSLGLSHSPLFHCMIWRQSGFLRKRNYKSNKFLDNNLNKWLRIQNSKTRMRRLITCTTYLFKNSESTSLSTCIT